MKLLLVVCPCTALTVLVCGKETRDFAVDISSASLADNSTDDLEIRVTFLEDDVTVLRDEVEEMETDINQLDYGLIIVEGNVAENSNDIDDLEMSVTGTEDLISVLDDDVTELDVLVATLQEENAQLQLTISQLQLKVNLLFQRITDLETTDAITNHTLNDLTEDMHAQQTQINNITEEVDFLDTEVISLNDDVTSLNEYISSQDVRLDYVEDDVDKWDDKITALEVANIDITDRMTVIEEILLEPWVSCVSSPCENGGTCIDVNVDTFICMCKDGFFGASCETGYSGTSFLATFDTATLTPTDPIVFNYPVHNTVGHYNPTTGICTTPIDGTYQFIFRIRADNVATIGAYLTVDGEDVTYTYENNPEWPHEGINMAVVLQLQTGQEVWVRPISTSKIDGVSSGNGMYSWFSRHLVYAL